MGKVLNENIRELRMQCGLNQVEFAQKMNVTKQCVSNWENDNVLPSIEMLIKMADFFKVSTDRLLGRITENTICVKDLTDEQVSHIRLLVKDFADLNRK
ncbi:MAG: helix-turn-helix transcriptional regulator [Clostridia bacterium]|nr:helix-turn-helix transcriptional regulator [Clostridia bacterium]